MTTPVHDDDMPIVEQKQEKEEKKSKPPTATWCQLFGNLDLKDKKGRDLESSFRNVHGWTMLCKITVYEWFLACFLGEKPLKRQVLGHFLADEAQVGRRIRRCVTGVCRALGGYHRWHGQRLVPTFAA